MAKIVFHLNCLEIGGAERVVTNLSEQFARDGFEVSVATQWQGEEEYTLYKAVKRVHVGLRPEDEKRTRISKYVRRIRYLKEYLDEERPDVVVAFARKANYRALMATWKSRIPVVIAVRIDPVGNYDGPLDRILIPLLFKRAAGGVFQTNDQRDYFRSTVAHKSRVILNPINTAYIGRVRSGERSKEIMHVGRLVAFKNQELLLKSFAAFHMRFPEYMLKLYGGDSGDGTKERLEALIQELKLQGSVFLMGSSSRIPEETENGAFFVTSSDLEGLPNALMEAMALGLPVISTDCPCGGPASIIANGKNGLLVPVRDQSALTDAMCYIAEHPDQAGRMGDEAKLLGQTAGPEAVYRQWKDYIESFIRKE